MMVNWKFAWREARQRPSRAILTLLSIIIGVAAVVAVTIAAGTTNRAFDQIFMTVAGRADLELSVPIGSGFDEKIPAKVARLPVVESVAPLVKRNTRLYVGRAKNYGMVVLGIDPAVDQQVRDYDITAGKMIDNKTGGVMLDANFAESAGIKLNQQIEFLNKEGITKTHVVAFYKPRGAAINAEGTTMLMPILAAQHFFKTAKKVDAAQIVLKPGVDKEAAREQIQAVLPEGVTVRPPETRSALADETSLSTQQGMRMARAFSLLVAVFIITNTFLINVTQRRKQLGIMRAIGGTRQQIAGMVFREAMLMGVIGTVIGSALGVLAAHLLTRAMGSLYQAKLPPIELTMWPFIVGTACGIGISLISAALPARKAAHLSPLEAMRDVRAEELEGSSRSLVIFGACAIAAGLVVMFLSVRGILPMLNAVWAAVLILIGVVLMIPMVLDPLSSAVAMVFKRFAPVEGKLARLQLLRHHSRTTLTIGVVFVAISTGIGLANSVMDTVDNVRNWYTKSIVADFYVRAETVSMATGAAASLPDTVGPEIKKVAGIKSLDALRFQKVQVGDEQATIVARDHSAPEAPDLDIVSGDLSKLREQMQNGEVALGSVLAERTKKKVGDEITLDSEGGPKKFRIAAIVNDYQGGGLTIHIERDVARKKLGLDGVDAYIIKADHDQLPEVRDELQEIATRSGLRLESAADIRAHIDSMMSGVVASLWGMVVLGLIVSSVGVTNTLTINVLEQTREIGLLRIVAMTRNQVRKTIFTQAMIVALLALIPGIAAGVGVAYLINLAMLPVTGHLVNFTLHPVLMLGGFVIGLLVVTLAAWFPANRASQLDLPTALRTL
jgi:putative ABC transport system permease protein